MHLKSNIKAALARAEPESFANETYAEPPAPAPIPPMPKPSILDLDSITGPKEPPQESPLNYGAPPSRDVSGFGGSWNPGPRRVDLSREEANLAAMLNLTPTEYARGKLELERRKQLDPERYSSRG